MLIQSDLFELLEIFNDDEYPWSLCIDDLESFLLLFTKRGMQKKELIQFLTIRQRLHSRLICSDELETCGAFMAGKVSLKNTLNKDATFVLTPDLTDVFDQVYRSQGLGFKNERNLELKTSGNYIPFGG